MNLADVTAKVQEALNSGIGFDKKVKFDFGDLGKLLIDGVAAKASNDDGPADATVSVNFDDFLKLSQGQLDPMMAFMSQKIKIAGDMGVVMKLQSLLTKIR